MKKKFLLITITEYFNFTCFKNKRQHEQQQHALHQEIIVEMEFYSFPKYLMKA